MNLMSDARTSDWGQPERGLSSAKSDAHISQGSNVAALEVAAVAYRGAERDDELRDQYADRNLGTRL
jgi:hypothetical protein